MTKKRRLFLYALFGLIMLGLIAGALYPAPWGKFLTTPPNPGPPPQKIYDNYLIVDEATGEQLMNVPLIVRIDDELISENNRLYRIVRVEENRAYARYMKTIKPAGK